MKLLVITQKVDRHDSILGFFHRWIEEFAKHFELVTVICLEKGEYNLPPNVKVLSLGKEANVKHSLFNKLGYTLRFYRYIWREKDNYDSVFVHMNQEYVILGWKIWKILGKKIYLWRNHAKGSLVTKFAVLVSNKVFYTSPQSYTARFKKAVQMPVGIDTDFFKPDPFVERIPNSILFLGRIAPVKRVSEFVDWLKNQNFSITTIAGSALPEDKDYEELVQSRALDISDKVRFMDSVTQEEALKLYQSHETYVNFTPAGSMDKTILEAAACETAVIVKNQALKILEGKNGKELRDFVIENHSLTSLAGKLVSEI